MSPLDCIVVDDEPLARRAVGRLLAESSVEVRLLGSFGSADAASIWLERHATDVALLDIDMPGTDGLHLARLLGTRALVVFTTAHARHAAESYDLDVVDYLLKPLRQARLDVALGKALDWRRLRTERSAASSSAPVEGASGALIVRADRRLHRVRHETLRYAQGMGDYTRVVLADGALMTAVSIGRFTAALPASAFVATSRSWTVGLRHVVACERRTVHLDRGEELPLSDGCRAAFVRAFESLSDRREAPGR